ncbi:MAG: ArsR family transcriptional regulator [Proteobacteria bacterium]|nr:ArsR family transcriptional regulator [Pseudomonadota bacterium]
MTQKYSSQELDNVYGALANSTRRKILTRLARDGSATITELASPFEMSLAAVSKHIKVLEKAGLLRKVAEGTIHRCYFVSAPIEGAAALVKYFEQIQPANIPADKSQAA